MTGAQGHGAAADDLISEAGYARVAQLLHGFTGIHLPPGKRAMVSARLSKPLRTLGVSGIDAYCAVLERPDANGPRAEFISALTTNTTQFNRESHHFDHLCEHVLPGLARTAERGGRVRIWSAGCSSGEEPYGLAFHVLDHCQNAPQRDVRILATDIDHRILDRAQKGLYPASALEPLPDGQAERYFTAAHSPTMRSVAPQARSLIAFRQLNLKGDWPFHGMFDIVFCRNVAIYFDQDTQTRLWQRLCDRILPGGVLCIGHSEHIPDPIARDFNFDGNGIFRRTEEPRRPTAHQEEHHEFER